MFFQFDTQDRNIFIQAFENIKSVQYKKLMPPVLDDDGVEIKPAYIDTIKSAIDYGRLSPDVIWDDLGLRLGTLIREPLGSDQKYGAPVDDPKALTRTYPAVDIPKSVLDARAAALAQDKLDNYVSYRKQESPDIDDKIDAILKQFENDKLNGKTLAPEMDALLDDIVTVNTNYPKPETKSIT